MMQSRPLFSKSFLFILFAQFFSAFADNALFFAEIALLKKTNSPDWEIPLLQGFFVLGYIFLAPFMAFIADKWSKRKVLIGANILKFSGAIMMALGVNPLLACVFVGIGSAIYSPAKYGILPEVVSPSQLVKANSLMEGITIVALLLGVLISGAVTDHSTALDFNIILAVFLVSIAFNFFIPHVPAAEPQKTLHIKTITKDFFQSLKALYRMRSTRYAIIDTSIFMASGATLRYLLVAWAPLALHSFSNEKPAILNSFTAIGVAIGAFIAAKFITIQTVHKASVAGILIGVVVIALTFTHHLYLAALFLIMIGIFGGIFLIPLNALVQEQGKETVGSGHAVAVQNFSENILTMAMVGIYSFLLHQNLPVYHLSVAFGLFISISIATVTYLKSKSLHYAKQNN